MSKNRMFREQPKSRLIVSISAHTVSAIDQLIRHPSESGHAARGNRSEFVRLAIEEKLARDNSDDFRSP